MKTKLCSTALPFRTPSSVNKILQNQDLSTSDQILSLNELLQKVEAEITKLTDQKAKVQNKIQDLKHPPKESPPPPTGPTSERKRKKAKLQLEVQELIEERTEVSEKIVDISEMISLNVGGIIYCTTKSTLLKYPGTVLHSMFTGRPTVQKDHEGNYFLDRDGNIFKYILNYLRTGEFPDLSRKELLELRVEAEFFSITTLVRALDKQLQSTIIGKFAVLRYNENSNVNNLSWQGMTEPCALKVGKHLYKCIDDVLTEVDNRGWELMQLGGDGNAEGGWKYVFRKKPNPHAIWRQNSNLERFINIQSSSNSLRGSSKTVRRKHSGSF